MNEVVVGFIFSAGFALTYLLASKLFEASGRARFSQLFCKSARSCVKSTATRPSKLSMTTGELSQHHSGETGA